MRSLNKISDVPLTLSVSLEPQRALLEQALQDAARRLASFAGRCGWQAYVKEGFCDSAEIYDSKEAFDATLLELCGYPPDTKLPETYSAALEKRILIAVSPEIYAKNYPQGIEEASYEKLLCHEMAHRLHIRILGGDEDAMGPVWFFEGFAIYASGQFEANSRLLEIKEIEAIISNPERGDYRLYGALLRTLLRFTSIQDLVERAGGMDFTLYVRKLISNL